MSKRAFLFGLAVVAVLIFSLYRAKYGAQETVAQIKVVEQEIAAEKVWLDGWAAIQEHQETIETLQLLADEEDADLSADIEREFILVEAE